MLGSLRQLAPCSLVAVQLLGLICLPAVDANKSGDASNDYLVMLIIVFVVAVAVYKVWYDANLPSARAYHLLVNSEQECQKLKDELSTEQDVLTKFKAMARMHSMCPSGASAGGDLGKFKQGMMDPVFDRAVFQTGQVGEVTGPVRTTFGYHLIYIVDRDDKKQR